MDQEVIDIADLDVVFLTYDEPKKEEFWVKISNLVPWAKRVDGVIGSDTAHKAAAEVSGTERFILIDGDNIPLPDFFGRSLVLTEANRNCIFRWKARNAINGLVYGNGGLSCWTKKFVQEMKTHENSKGEVDTAVEFCFDKNYIPMHDCFSTTYPNNTPFQAWRAGFREGVKLALLRGERLGRDRLFLDIPGPNLDRLSIWHSIGMDSKNGIWAILGSRMGTYMTALTDWNYKEVQNFALLENMWNTSTLCHPSNNEELEKNIIDLGTSLTNQTSLRVMNFTKDQSRFFRHHYLGVHQNRGIMVTEAEFLRNE